MIKIALVTGSTRGIGRGIADALRHNGYTVVYSGTRTVRPEDLGDAHYFGCDIGEAAARDALFAFVIEKFGRLDVLINNAGVAPTERRDVLSTTEDSFDRVVDTNLKGTYFMCQAAANLMIGLLNKGETKREGEAPPRIVNISSISAYTASVNRGEYCVSKAGIAMVTQLFAARLAQYGIPVFEVRPGIIKTDMTSGVLEKYQAMIDGGLTPIARLGEPGDVAGMVLAACSGMLDFTTGQVLNADGGFHLRRL